MRCAIYSNEDSNTPRIIVATSGGIWYCDACIGLACSINTCSLRMSRSDVQIFAVARISTTTHC